MNQMVAQRLLNNLGCQVDVANDGVDAIEILERTNKYDLIFMDCHMPVSAESIVQHILHLCKRKAGVFIYGD